MAKKTIPRPLRAERIGPAASTPEGRESELISLAHDLAAQQMRDGTASSQVIAHFLKLGGAKERLEKELLEQQVQLSKAKTEMLQASKNVAALYENALSAFAKYNGADNE